MRRDNRTDAHRFGAVCYVYGRGCLFIKGEKIGYHILKSDKQSGVFARGRGVGLCDRKINSRCKVLDCRWLVYVDSTRVLVGTTLAI